MKGIKGLQGKKSYMGDNMMRGSMKKRGTNMNMSMSSIPNRSGRCVGPRFTHGVRGPGTLASAPVLTYTALITTRTPGAQTTHNTGALSCSGASEDRFQVSINSLTSSPCQSVFYKR